MNGCNEVVKMLKIKPFSGRFGPVISVHTDFLLVNLNTSAQLNVVFSTPHVLFYPSQLVIYTPFKLVHHTLIGLHSKQFTPRFNEGILWEDNCIQL